MNQERIDRLFSCRNEQGFDSISYDKRKILEDLYKDSDIIEILNNKELQAVNACPEDYYNVNICPIIVQKSFEPVNPAGIDASIPQVLLLFSQYCKVSADYPYLPKFPILSSD